MISTSKNEDSKRCVRCILPDSLPSVHLGDDGTCNHCNTFNGLMKDWNNNKSGKEEELKNIIALAKKKKQKYDCLVTLSGGKDSTFALYLAANVYKLNCLCVTFDNGYLSDFARNNIKNAVASANADHIYYTVNRNNLLESYNLALKKTGQFCSVCMRGITACGEFPLKAFNIPMKISGDGKRISYLNSFPEVFEGGNAYYFTQMIKGEPVESHVRSLLLLNGSLQSRVSKKLKSKSRSLFKLPDSNGTVHVELYDHVEFSPDKILKTIKEEMGWTKPEGEFEHIDCLLHEMQHYVNIFKFKEITAKTFYRSYQVRLGTITRDEALTLDKEDLKNPPEPEVLDSFLKDIDMSRDDFYSSVKDWKNIDRFRSNGRKMMSD